MMKASRPEMRWAVPAQGAPCRAASRRPRAALSTWTQANASATLASQTFIAIVEEKKSVKTSCWLGSWTFP